MSLGRKSQEELCELSSIMNGGQRCGEDGEEAVDDGGAQLIVMDRGILLASAQYVFGVWLVTICQNGEQKTGGLSRSRTPVF